MREYSCIAIENQLAALCFARSSQAMRASLATNLCPKGLVALGLAESRRSYVCGVALSREPPQLQQAEPLLAKCHQEHALLPSCDTRFWQAELRVPDAHLRREATAVIAKAASAVLYDTAEGYLVWVCGRVGACFAIIR